MSSNVSITFRPLTHWPPNRERTTDADRVEARFKAPGRVVNHGTDQSRYISPKPIPIEQTYDDLDLELWTIGAADVVVQVDVADEGELRRDGRPRADRRPRSPAVVLTFKRNGTVHTFACDRFTRWQDNLRGITLGLEGLRRLERYGIVQSGEQYRGWQALPSSATPALSPTGAASVIAARSKFPSRLIEADADTAKLAVRAARAKTHPDSGGRTSDFTLVQEAARVLSIHHGVTL